MAEKRWTMKWVGTDVEASDRYVSVEAAKADAREMRRWKPERNLTFQILDPQGAPYQHTEQNGSWRMKWLWSAAPLPV